MEEYALLRRLIGVAGEIAELGYSVPEDVSKALDRAESLVYEVNERRVTDSTQKLSSLLSENLDRLEQLYERGDAITGTPTGYLDLDQLLSGLQPSSLVVVGARPAMGKTSFALGMIAHAALEATNPSPVLFFSLEMSNLELSQRLLCAEARVDSTRVRNGQLQADDWQKISRAMGRLAEAPIWIDDNPNLTIMEIRAKARRLKSQIGNLGMIVIDYLQLMSGRSNAENRQVEVSELSRGLKILARELETPVVALSQLSRGLEMRADKRPDALRPARERQHRAGLRRRHVHLPRGDLRPASRRTPGRPRSSWRSTAPDPPASSSSPSCPSTRGSPTWRAGSTEASVLFEQRFWEPIARGEVTVTFRRWKRRQALAGRRYRTGGGIIEVDAIEIVDESDITEPGRPGGPLPVRRGPRGRPPRHPRPRPLPDPVPHRRRARPPVAPRRVGRAERRRRRRARSPAPTARRGQPSRPLDRARRWSCIARRPGVRAGDLADELGRERLPFKADVRKLKNLGPHDQPRRRLPTQPAGRGLPGHPALVRR